MEPQRSTWDELPLKEKLDTIQALALIPAVGAMLLFRRDIGCRMLNPAWLVTVSVATGAVGFAAGETPDGIVLIAYAFAILVAGFTQRIRRLREFRRGESPHTYYLGTSDLEALPFLGSLRRNRRVERFFDPLCCIVAGLAVFDFAPFSGMWLSRGRCMCANGTSGLT